MEKKDPYKHKERFEKWHKEKKLNGVNQINKKTILRFIDDMYLGVNVSKSSKKGSRSYVRLNTLRQRLVFIVSELEKRGVKDIKKVSKEQLHRLFEDMRNGIIKTRKNTTYKSTRDYVKIFKSFWHWLQKVEDIKPQDICEDLDARGEKPKFVYFTEEDFNNIVKEAGADLKPILSLAFDSGMRVTELINTRISDFINDYKELNIREEVSKTFGRRIKLMLCSEQIKKYVQFMELSGDDYLTSLNPATINKELRRIGKKVLTGEQIKHKNLSLYDFRHSSCCFWLPRYKSESALKYRFGWKKTDMIHYYSEFLGMEDTIKEDDLYINTTKTELEKQLDKQQKQIEKFKEERKQDKFLLEHFMEITLKQMGYTDENAKVYLKERGFHPPE